MSNRIIEIPNGGGSSGTLEQALMFAASGVDDDLEVGLVSNDDFEIPFDINSLTIPSARVTEAPVDADIIIDLLANGVSILSTPITIENGSNSSLDAATQPVLNISSLSKGDVITRNITQVGSTNPGKNLKITLAYEAQANISGGGGELEYQTEITTSTTLTTQEGLNKVYPVNSASDVVITVPQGVYSENDVINFERRGEGTVEFVGANDNVRLRGVRDVENRYFINNKYSWVSLICRENNEFSVVGRLKDGYTGEVTTSNYSILTPNPSAQDVTVTGTGFSSNMLVTLTGNATLNSFTVNSPVECVLNITPSGSNGDQLTVIYDNGDIFTDTNAITLSDAKLFDTNPFEFGWALFQMNSAITYALRGRRSSDNAETDIGFNSSGKVALDSPVSVGGDLTTWAGSNDVFVVTRYNQGSLGSSFDLTQADTTKQAKFLNAGSLIIQDTRTFIEYDGVDDVLQTSGTTVFNTDLSVFSDVRSKSATEGVMIAAFPNATNDRAFFVRYQDTNVIRAVRQDIAGGSPNVSSPSVSINTNINSVLISNTTETKISANGVFGTADLGSITTPTTVSNPIDEGGLLDLDTNYLDGYRNYAVIYKSDQEVNITAIQSIINAAI